MRIRLYDDKAIAGMPFAFLANGQPVFPAMGGDGSGSDGSDDESGDEEEEDEDDEDEDASGEGDDSGDTGKAKKDSETEDLKAQMEKIRKRMKAADRRAGAAEAELKALREKDTPELDKLKRDHEELVAQHAEATENLNAARLENAVLKDTQFAWNDPEDVVEMARRALRKGDLEIDEDGEVDGVAAWLKELAQRKPHYVKAAERRKRRNSDDDDDEEQPTGSGVGSGKKKGNAKLDEAALRQRFPALR